MTPHQKIIRAAGKGRGIRLSADEVFALSRDDAIVTRAHWDDNPQVEEEKHQRLKREQKQ